MSFLSKGELPYSLSALLILLIFYGIYLTKTAVQKRHGIKTRQIGRRKEKSIHTVEVLMSIATGCIIPAQILSIIFSFNYIPSSARFTGFCIGIIGDIIFLISVLCMKDNWRAGLPDKDKTELVTNGIYKFSRNPAFLGFYFQYIGVFLMYGNPLTAFFTAFAITMLHMQVLQEERYLQSIFGEQYASYRRQVFRYLGRRK